MDYPLVFLPPEIEKARALVPIVQPFRELPPPHPGQEPQRFQVGILILELVVTFALGLMVSPYFIPIGILASVGHIGLMAYQYPRKHRRFVNAMRSYMGELEAYNRNKQKHERQQQLQQSPEQVAAYRTKAVLSALAKTFPNDGNNSQAQTGRSEWAFGEVLQGYFGSLIQTRVTLSIPDYRHPYSPDFAYIDPTHNLFIDIEIDEPYTGDPPKAIHYIGKDDKRNQFFSERGWIVIRFAEQQVVEQPDSCCKVIAELIADLLNEPAHLLTFTGVAKISPIKQWTKAEASEMAKNRFREQYKKL